MSRRLRFLLLWLLALALPVQGLASAAMLHCAPSHERMQGLHGDAARVAGAGAAQSATQSADPLAAHHVAYDEGRQAVAAGHGASDADAGKVGDPRADQGKYSCSACAACCAAWVLSGRVPGVAAPQFAPTVFAAVTYVADAFAAEGPERPPRLLPL